MSNLGATKDKPTFIEHMKNRLRSKITDLDTANERLAEVLRRTIGPRPDAPATAATAAQAISSTEEIEQLLARFENTVNRLHEQLNALSEIL